MVSALMDLDGTVVVDLFAGTGALGIEALSRGAANATFVESGGDALAALGANLATLALGPDRATVVRADALRWVARPGVVTAGPVVAAGGATVDGPDLVLADPPYAFDRWSELLASLAAWRSLVVLESGVPLGLGERWVRIRERRYGATVVTVARSAGPPAALVEPKVPLVEPKGGM